MIIYSSLLDYSYSFDLFPAKQPKQIKLPIARATVQ